MTSFTRADLKRWANDAGPDSPLHDLVKATRSGRGQRVKAKDLPPSLGRTFTIVVPMPESLTNSGKGRSRHFMSIASAKKRYFDMLDRRVAVGLIPVLHRDGPVGRASVTSVMYLGARMDADNAMARHKWPIDWLQASGRIANDRYLIWIGQPTQIVKRGQEYRIELTLTEP